MVGPLVGYWTARMLQNRQATSAAELARRQRVQANREATYVDVLEYAYLIADYVDRTEPFIAFEGDPGTARVSIG